MISSKPKIKKINTVAIRNPKKLLVKIKELNAHKINNNVCPDIKLANNHIAKLNALAIYDINSITIKNGNINSGAAGIKILKNLLFKKKKPKNVKNIINDEDKKKFWPNCAVETKL